MRKRNVWREQNRRPKKSPKKKPQAERVSDSSSIHLLAEIKALANNAIYFDDGSDYRSTLWEICNKSGMDDDSIGVKMIEANRGIHG